MQAVSLQGYGKFHYDRIGTLLELAGAHHELGEYDPCDQVVNETLLVFRTVMRKRGTRRHPWEEKLCADWELWKEQREHLMSTHHQPLLLGT